MSKKHFIDAAKQIAIEARTNPAAAKIAAEILADIFKQSNSNFDRERFLTACGVE